MKDLSSSFEEILSSVEEDESLKNGTEQERLADEESSGEAALGGTGLGALLTHPELLSKLPLLLRTVQTLSEPAGHPFEKRPETPTALLCALRPYLSETRQRALDTMIKVSKLTETLRSMR